MKKIIILFLLIWSFVFLANAEIDISSLSFDELISLQNEVSAAIWKKILSNESSLYSGVYKIGDSLSSGDYIIIFIGNSPLAGEIRVFSDYMNYEYKKIYPPMYEITNMEYEATVHLHLEDGQILEIGIGPYLIYKLK